MKEKIDPIARLVDEAAWKDHPEAKGRSVALWRNRRTASQKKAREILLEIVGLR